MDVSRARAGPAAAAPGGLRREFPMRGRRPRGRKSLSCCDLELRVRARGGALSLFAGPLLVCGVSQRHLAFLGGICEKVVRMLEGSEHGPTEMACLRARGSRGARVGILGGECVLFEIGESLRGEES